MRLLRRGTAAAQVWGRGTTLCNAFYPGAAPLSVNFPPLLCISSFLTVVLYLLLFNAKYTHHTEFDSSNKHFIRFKFEDNIWRFELHGNTSRFELHGNTSRFIVHENTQQTT
jgi:hypothetical protein